MSYTYNFKQDLDSGSYTYTNYCIHCDEFNSIILDELDYFNWRILKHNIVDVFPWLSIDHRELLISGTHPKCWNEMTDIIDSLEA
jgi:hypothetical protein